MPSLVNQRCLNHAQREAVARCPACGHYFCRECIAEHDDRVICASCLAKIAHSPLLRRRRLVMLRRAVCGLVGFIIAWFFFYSLAQVLLQIPTQTHETAMSPFR